MNRNSEQLLSKALRNDQVGEPDKTIEDRLMYAFLLKSSSVKVRQNSFSSFAGWLFSGQHLGMKAGFVSLVLFFSLFTNQLAFDPGKVSANDSITNQRILVADSAHFIQLVDSLRVDSLN